MATFNQQSIKYVEVGGGGGVKRFLLEWVVFFPQSQAKMYLATSIFRPNCLEALAAFLAINCFVTDKAGLTILLRLSHIVISSTEERRKTFLS